MSQPWHNPYQKDEDRSNHAFIHLGLLKLASVLSDRASVLVVGEWIGRRRAQILG